MAFFCVIVNQSLDSPREYVIRAKTQKNNLLLIFCKLFPRSLTSQSGEIICKVLGIELNGNILEKLSEYAGNLRLSFDAAENEKKLSKLRSLGLDNDEQKMLDLAEKLAKELELGYSGIIRKSVTPSRRPASLSAYN